MSWAPRPTAPAVGDSCRGSDGHTPIRMARRKRGGRRRNPLQVLRAGHGRTRLAARHHRHPVHHRGGIRRRQRHPIRRPRGHLPPPDPGHRAAWSIGADCRRSWQLCRRETIRRHPRRLEGHRRELGANDKLAGRGDPLRLCCRLFRHGRSGGRRHRLELPQRQRRPHRRNHRHPAAHRVGRRNNDPDCRRRVRRRHGPKSGTSATTTRSS